MKLTVRCRSGLRIDFEGTLDELERFDGFLAELARLERDRLAPAPLGTENPAGSPQVAAFEPFPGPSPPTAPGLAAPPDGGDRRPDTPAADTAGGSSRPPARTSPPAGGTGRPGPHAGTPGYGQAATLALQVIERLGECSKQQIMDETGSGRSTLTKVLRELRDQGAIVATGATTDRRYRLAGDDNVYPAQPDPDGALVGEHGDEAFAAGIDALSRAALSPAPGPEPDDENDVEAADPEPAPPVVRRQQSPHEGRVIGAGARAAMDAQRDERHDQHRQQIVALVAEHGPVSFSWVADQLVKNRRDTAALMRAMAAAGELVDQGGYFNVPDGDEEARAA